MTQVALRSSDAQGDHFASTAASNTTMAMGGHTEKQVPEPSNQTGPAYAYKVHRDHGAAGVISM